MQLRSDLDDRPDGRDQFLAEVGQGVIHARRGRRQLGAQEDAYLFVVLSWAPHLGVDLARWPRLGAFSQRVAMRNAVQAALSAEGLQKVA